MPASSQDQLFVVGQPLPRSDGEGKVTGSARYVADMRLPGMLYGKILRSPYPYAQILSIDVSAAKQVPGVMGVVTYKDAPSKTIESTGEESAGAGGSGNVHILDSTVRHVGDEVAAVAATDLYTARQAAKLIKVQYKPLPYVLDALAAMQPGAPVVRGGGNVATGKPIVLNRGDVAAGFAQATDVYQDTFNTQFTTGMPLEPRACLAEWSDGPFRLTLYSGGRFAFGIRGSLAAVFGLPLKSVRVDYPTIGASYGNKDESRLIFITALLAKVTGRPVLTALERSEEFLGGIQRHPANMQMKVGFQADGSVAAVDVRHVLNTGPYQPGIAVTKRSMNGPLMLYRTPNAHGVGYTIYTNALIAGSYRGLGAPQGHFGIESLMDDIAHKRGIDPLQFRLDHIVGQAGQPGASWKPNGQIVDPETIAAGIPFTSYGLRECLIQGAALAQWDQRNPTPGADVGKSRYLKGKGVAAFIYKTSFMPTGALIYLYPDGTATLVMGNADVGEGARTILMQMAAETLGIRWQDISGRFGDTAVAPYAHITAGSATTFSSGWAVVRAAEDLRGKVFALAAPLLKATPDQLQAHQGVISVVGDPTRSIPFAKAAAKMGGVPWLPGNSRVNPGSTTGIVDAFGADFVDVEVDSWTGKVQMLQQVAARDAGRPINPNTLDSQIVGGSLQGLGYGLMEEHVFDTATGVPLTTDMAFFLTPTMMDVPDKVVAYVAKTIDPDGPFGAKSVAEPGLVPSAPAVANAIFNATGVRFHSIPITPDRLLAGLAGAKV